jgi:hypothetical protein
MCTHWKRACLAGEKPWDPSPEPQRINNNDNNNYIVTKMFPSILLLVLKKPGNNTNVQNVKNEIVSDIQC